ncbi:serine/threonine protein kinase [Chloroflexi bacterium TSY]|nr:serine/threonine protein kinase [Chloroflexi bacterium TSY]
MSSAITQIDSYRPLEIIGQGGTSTISHAINMDTHQDVALKVLNPQAALDPSYVRRFLKESKNVQRLQHPNIVKIFDANESDGFHYIAMELVVGGSLADYLKRQDQLISPDHALQILHQAAAGLDHAHQLDILHRDIKLSNLLIAEDGTTLLSDFGSAKSMASDATMVTQAGFSVGTPTFMSPEQARGDGKIDQRSDIYSLSRSKFQVLRENSG